MKWILIAVVGTLVMAVVATVMQALTWNAGVPSLDDPKQVTPPPARETIQNDQSDA